MPRTAKIPVEKAKSDVKQIYATIEKHMGGKVPNIFQHMGNSAPVLKGYFGLSDAINLTSLSPQLREQIALVIAQANQCNYCLSAHTTISKSIGLPQQQIMQARKGDATDPKTQAILRFVKLVVEKRSHVSDQEVAALKAAGVSDAELVEIIMVININMFTNYFNNIIGTEVDFPEAPKLQ